jgi:hypothetical protein
MNVLNDLNNLGLACKENDTIGNVNVLLKSKLTEYFFCIPEREFITSGIDKKRVQLISDDRTQRMSDCSLPLFCDKDGRIQYTSVLRTSVSHQIGWAENDMGDMKSDYFIVCDRRIKTFLPIVVPVNIQVNLSGLEDKEEIINMFSQGYSLLTTALESPSSRSSNQYISGRHYADMQLTLDRKSANVLYEKLDSGSWDKDIRRYTNVQEYAKSTGSNELTILSSLKGKYEYGNHGFAAVTEVLLSMWGSYKTQVLEK